MDEKLWEGRGRDYTLLTWRANDSLSLSQFVQFSSAQLNASTLSLFALPHWNSIDTSYFHFHFLQPQSELKYFQPHACLILFSYFWSFQLLSFPFSTLSLIFLLHYSPPFTLYLKHGVTNRYSSILQLFTSAEVLPHRRFYFSRLLIHYYYFTSPFIFPFNLQRSVTTFFNQTIIESVY